MKIGEEPPEQPGGVSAFAHRGEFVGFPAADSRRALRALQNPKGVNPRLQFPPASQDRAARGRIDPTVGQAAREAGKDHDIAASEFVLGMMTTALPEAACLVSVSFPVWSEARVGTGFHEVNARASANIPAPRSPPKNSSCIA